MSGEQWGDVEGGLRAWLRADTGLQALVVQRVFFGIPRQDPVFPLVVVARVGGSELLGEETPVDYALLQIECWGSLLENGGSKAQAFAVAQAVQVALSTIRQPTLLTTGVKALSATVQALLWAPDPDTDQPRYLLTVEVPTLAS